MSSDVRQRHRASSAQLRYLSQAVLLEEASSPRLLSFTAILVSLSVAGFLVWAWLTPINEVSRASGEIVPSGYEQVVQHLDGGIVRSIEVKAGDVVRAGQVLVRIDDGTTIENLERERSKLLFLTMTAHRLRSDLEGTRPDFAGFTAATSEDVAAQLSLFENTLDEREGRKRIVTDQISQKQREVAILERRFQSVEQTLASERELLKSRQHLHAKGLLANSSMIRTKQAVVRLESQADELREEIEQAQVAFKEFSERLAAIDQDARLQVSNELNATVSQIRQATSTIQLLERRHARQDLRAPVNGVVKELIVNTVGGILRSGQAVMKIVPVGEELVADAKIEPSDIGHVRVGQSVNVKVSAYDFSRYGLVRGRLQQISAMTIQDPEGGRYYRGRVRLEQPFVGVASNKRMLLPGMEVMVDIETGEKTVLEYLLKPVTVAAATAFSER